MRRIMKAAGLTDLPRDEAYKRLSWPKTITDRLDVETAFAIEASQRAAKELSTKFVRQLIALRQNRASTQSTGKTGPVGDNDLPDNGEKNLYPRPAAFEKALGGGLGSTSLWKHSSHHWRHHFVAARLSKSGNR